MLDLVENPANRFSCNAAHMSAWIRRIIYLDSLKVIINKHYIDFCNSNHLKTCNQSLCIIGIISLFKDSLIGRSLVQKIQLLDIQTMKVDAGGAIKSVFIVVKFFLNF